MKKKQSSKQYAANQQANNGSDLKEVKWTKTVAPVEDLEIEKFTKYSINLLSWKWFRFYGSLCFLSITFEGVLYFLGIGGWIFENDF